MHTLTDVHMMFAECFPESDLRPFAWLLSKCLEEGHVCLRMEELPERSEDLPYPSLPADRLQGLRRWVGQPGERKPFILEEGRLYLQRYHAYEARILQRLEELVEAGRRHRMERWARLEAQAGLIQSLGATHDLGGLSAEERVDWQLVAALNALTDQFSIITGGPGTGKTTTLAKLLRILFACEPQARVALAAPTGKAAMRMLESLQRSAQDFPLEVRRRLEALHPSTLHRLLGWQKGQVSFQHGVGRPLDADLVVVDEASMIDLPLFAKLLDACGPQTRLVLLGDKDQLASVEAGSLLGDLCLAADAAGSYAFESVKADWLNGFITDPARQLTDVHRGPAGGLLAGRIVELRLSHRFRAQGEIGRLSRAIIAGQADVVMAMADGPASPELRFDTQASEAALGEFVEGYADYIREQDPLLALKKLNQLRVLVAVKEGPRGLHAVNRGIEQILQSQRLILTGTDFYLNRPVIVTRNNYELGLFNGDVGITRQEGGRCRVYFEAEGGGLRHVAAASLSHCETVYAMTIHKSQGSEFDRVLLWLPEGTDTPILTRELLYTGVTRARASVVLHAPTETLRYSVEQQVRRASGIPDRLGAWRPTSHV